MTTSGAIDLAVDLAKRIKEELVIASSMDPSFKVHSKDALYGSENWRNNGMWKSSLSSDRKKSQSFKLHSQRPFSSKARIESSPSKTLHVLQSVTPAKTRPVCTSHAKAKAKFEKKRKKIENLDDFKDLRIVNKCKQEHTLKAMIRQADPSFDLLFVPVAKALKPKYDYADPIPLKYSSLNGNSLSKKMARSDDIFMRKIIELKRAEEASVLVEKETWGNPSKDGDAQKKEKSNIRTAEKSKSMEVLTLSNKVATKRSQSGLGRSKSVATLNDLESSKKLSGFHSSCISVNRRTCWKEESNSYGNKRRSEFNSDMKTKGNFICKLCGKKSSSLEEARLHKDCCDPARCFRNSLVKKFLSVKKSCVEGQLKSSIVNKDIPLSAGSSSTTGLAKNRGKVEEQRSEGSPCAPFLKCHNFSTNQVAKRKEKAMVASEMSCHPQIICHLGQTEHRARNLCKNRGHGGGYNDFKTSRANTALGITNKDIVNPGKNPQDKPSLRGSKKNTSRKLWKGRPQSAKI